MGSSVRICQRLGAFGGIAVGLVFWSAAAPIVQIVIAGFLVALVVTLTATLFLKLIGGYPIGSLVILILLISLLEGLLLAPLATVVPDLFISMVGCSLIGMLLGWLLCLWLCRFGRLSFGRGLG